MFKALAVMIKSQAYLPIQTHGKLTFKYFIFEIYDNLYDGQKYLNGNFVT